MEASRYKSILPRAGLALAVLMLSGCDSALLNPKGAIGVQEKELIITSLLLMLIVVIPVILMTIYFSFKYRASNTDQEYAPEWSHSTKIEVIVWTIPIIIIAILGTITWHSTHELEPSKPLVSDVEPMTIEVVSLDWKWLFIYPDQKIATVNYVAFPKDVPVQFKLTSDNIMNSFFIPRLGSQIYAMPGMVTRLHLIANHEGDFKGVAASYSGEGFSHMKFTATALPDQASFDNWVQQVKASPDTLEDLAAYKSLAKPSIDAPVTYYSKVVPELFTNVVTQYPGSMNASFDAACLVSEEG
ncbi:cytochrome bo3 quinol oxidase subunit 2 [Vibrio xiamenensis]|uniref:Ubiquinol oxidase subunit 2 n=1 Tax=Vibrio xiamenensis TaxID=861298 RepID=A0A1G7X8S6_9VIBR|nr:ubiquinol oxidase subunit II [Vibrio xiamenensis]SDG80537.1 cytochrome bo3 quinol oxidase subunit 2 [Vibrio xiamenensis]